MSVEQISVTLPNTQADREKIRKAIIEGAGSMMRIEAEREHIKAIKQLLKEEYELPPTFVSQIIKTYHKQNFAEVSAKSETFVELYEELSLN